MTASATPAGRHEARLLAAVVVLAVAVRLGVSVPRIHTAPDDPDNYLPVARSIAEGRGFSLNGKPTAYRPPLYPALLAPLVRVVDGPGLRYAVVGLHAALGAATVLLTARAARRMGLTPRRVTVAAALVAFDPVLVVQSRAVMTETLAAALVAWSLSALTATGRGARVRAGLVLGLAVLCRPSLLASTALVGVTAVVAPPGQLATRIRRATALALGLVACLAPWTLRNARTLGEPVWGTTHGGYTLYLANNPVYYREVLDGPPGATWSGPNQAAWFQEVNRAAAGLPEPQGDRHFRDEALRFIRAHPADFARAAMARLSRFWGLAPAPGVYPDALRAVCAAWTLPFWIAVVLGLRPTLRAGWPRASAVAIVLGLTLVHLAFWTDLRMRAPLVPALALIAAAAAVPRPARHEAEPAP